MVRYQACRLLGYLLLAALAGAAMVQTVLVELGIVSADGLDGINGIIGRVILLPLSVVLTGALFLGTVYDICTGEWRKSTARELRWRLPRSGQEWGALAFFAAVVLAGAGVTVVGFLGGLRFKDLSGTTFDVAPAAFWVAGGVLMLGGVVALLVDEWRDEVGHMPRGSSRLSSQEPINGVYISFSVFPVHDGEHGDNSPGSGPPQEIAGEEYPCFADGILADEFGDDDGPPWWGEPTAGR